MQNMKKLIAKIRESNFYGKTFVVSIFFLIILKQVLLHNTAFLTSDIFILLIVLTLVTANSLIKSKIAKPIINTINIFILIVFVLDIVAIYAFQSRLSIPEMEQFFLNTNSTFFDVYLIYGIICLLVFLCINFFITQRFIRKIRVRRYTRPILLGLWIVGISFIWIFTKTSTETMKTQLDIIRYNISFFQNKNNFLQNTEVWTGKQYKDFFSLQNGEWKRPNIILIYAESFSAVDSKRVGWLYDNMPLFDKIQEQWITYTNFLANGCTSETTHIATLQWVEPREHPSMTKENAYSEYTSLNPPLPQFLEENGYTTTFLSTVTLDFLNQKQFLKDMWFDKIYGDEVFKKEKTYTFWAAPDRALYAKAVELMKQQSAPYFLALQTISSHEPYETPDGNWEKITLKYVDKNIYTFYQDLQKAHFFDNGILIILADHRKIDIASDAEKEKYGKTTPSRILWTVVGKWIPKWVIYDTPIQHIDFYYSLKKLVWKNNILTRDKYNDVFTNKENRDWAIRYCRYFLNDNWYVIMKGQKEWYNIESWETYIKEYINAYKIFQYNNRQSRTKTTKNYLSWNFTERLLKETFKN